MQNKKIRETTAEHAKYISALNQKLDLVVNKLAEQGAALAAVVEIIGAKEVENKINDMKLARKNEREEQLKQSVQFLLANEILVPAIEGATVQADSFVVVNEVLADGTSDRGQFEMKRLDKAGQARYLGKQVGDEVTNPDVPGVKVIIIEIYSLDMVKYTQFVAAKKAEAAQAAQVQEIKP